MLPGRCLLYTSNPLWVAHPTLEHVLGLITDTDYPSWWLNTMLVTIGSTTLSLLLSIGGAYSVERLRFRGSNYVGLAIFLEMCIRDRRRWRGVRPGSW